MARLAHAAFPSGIVEVGRHNLVRGITLEAEIGQTVFGISIDKVVPT